MQSGTYIVDRLMPRLIRTICHETGITYASLSEDWIIRLCRGERNLSIYGYKFGCNDVASGLISQDKVASHLVLTAAGVPSVPHVLLCSVPGQPIDTLAAQNVFDVHPAAVLKPLTGTGARGIFKVNSCDAMQEIIQSRDEPGWTLSPWLDITAERRLIMLDDTVLLAYEKRNPTMRQGLKLFNLGTGAIAKVGEPDTEHVKYAQQAMIALGLRLAAVDIVTLSDGSLRVLEVNDGLMMENFAHQSPAYKQKATETYRRVLRKLLF